MHRVAAAEGAADLAPRLAAAAAARRAELVDALRRISSLDAPSGDPGALAPVADLLDSWLAGLDGRVSRHASIAGPHLEAEFGPPARPGEGVLVLCHYDTVWPAGTAAARPFRVESELAHGPGVLDMRGGIVATLGALELLSELDALHRPVRVLITADEETGSRASRDLIAARAREAQIALVPEPALPGGALKTARKGWITYALRVRGRAAHAGLEPEAGVSAIDELVDHLIELRRLADPAAGTTINCGLVRGGNAANVIAARAEAEIDVRFPDGAEEARVRAAFADLRAERSGAELEIEELHSRPPLERTPAIAAAAERARALGALLGLELAEGSAGGVSDGNLAAAEGVPVLDGLGPEGGGAHAIDEQVSVPSLVDRAALMALLIAEV
ncbi:MAG: M20 family metallopeptidase [Solirubrobacterales bacterium]